ncbi:12573_t:CDS:2, partial [Acaulospora morrowiae]
MAKRLRKIGGKHTSRVHGKNYAEGDTSDSESESNDSLELKLSDLKAQASTSQPKNNNYNPFGSQIAEIDS